MNKVLVVDQNKCTNCRLCELSCSMVKTGEFNPIKSKIRLNAFPKDVAYIPLACFQCGDAPCVDVCPTGALEYRESDLADANKGKDFARKIVEAGR